MTVIFGLSYAILSIVELNISAARLRTTFTVLVVFLTALSFIGTLSAIFLHMRLGGLVRLMGVDHENSFPTWYSAVALAAAAALLAAITATLRARKQTRDLFAWATLAFIFALLSLDEIAGIHEGVGKELKKVIRLGGWFRFSGVVPSLALATLVGAIMLPFLSRLASRRRNQFLAAGLLFVGGAVGMEMIGGKLFSAAGDQLTLAYAVCFHIEEFLEMIAIVIFNAALIEHLAELLGPDGLRLRFTNN